MKIGLLGHGVVGSGVRRIIDEGKTQCLSALEIKKILVRNEKDITDANRMTTDINEILNDPEIDIVVECIGGVEPARTYALEAMKKGKSFVTSNKKMLATCFQELMEIAKENHVSIGYEASCGGGIPWMANLDRTKRIDMITSFRGIFNGTTNFILSKMYQDESEFEEMLKEAQRLGYAEADPSDDIDGFDVRYKVALSCAKAFGKKVDVEAIPVFGIRNIRKCDFMYAKNHGYGIKLVGSADITGKAIVIPMFLKQGDVLSSIPLNYNAIESVSDTLGSAMYIGQGAGSLPTAHAVVQDILDAEKKSEENAYSEYIVDNTGVEGVYYIRTKNRALYDGLIEEEAKDGFLTKRVSFEKIQECVLQDSGVFLAEVKND